MDWKRGAAPAEENEEGGCENEPDACELKTGAEVHHQSEKDVQLPEVWGARQLTHKECGFPYIAKPEKRDDQVCREAHDNRK